MPLRLLILICVCLTGCSAVETLQEDYLKADQFDESTINEAFRVLRRDYLGMDDSDKDLRRQARLAAYDRIMRTPYAKDYEALRPVIDDDLKAPEAAPYIFIHFFPKKERKDLNKTSYLVVFSRIQHKIVYAGKFTFPSGDPLYRYYSVLAKL